MNEQAPELGGELFAAQRYEALRNAALGCACLASHAHGLAVLTRQGMAAWMQVWARYTPPSREAPRTPPLHPPGEPNAAPPEMVAVLAKIAWAAHQQSVT